MNLPRTAISLYVALAIHALLALFFAVQPAPQWPSGRQVGLSAVPVTLSAADRASLQAESAAPKIIPESKFSARTASPSTLPPTSPPRASGLSAATLPKPIRRPANVSTPDAPGTEMSSAAVRPRGNTAITSSREHEQFPDRRAADASQVHTAAPAAQTQAGADSSYFSDLRQHLASHRRSLPLEQVAAVAIIDVQIQPDGRLGQLRLATSSGIPALDQEALDLIYRASPLPSPPGGRPLRLSIPIQIHQAARYPP